MAKDTTRPYHFESRVIHGDMKSRRWSYEDHIVPPIGASTSYRLESTARGAAGFQAFANPDLQTAPERPIYIYDRLDEPSRGMLEDNLRDAEGGGTAVTFATGMAAISAALGVLLKAGDTLVSHRTIYGCTYSLLTNWLPRLGIRTVFVDLGDLEALRRVLDEEPEVKVVYGESPCNPSLELLDLAAISTIVTEHNERGADDRPVRTVIDNTFSTPWCQRPIEHGIDVVVHSLTKNIAGFGTEMGGAVIAPAALEPDLLLYRKDFGGVLSSQAAWSILVHGLPTLPVRARQQMETAAVVAQFLEDHPAVDKVVYPGLESHPQHELARRQMVDPDGEFAPCGLIYFVLAGHGELARSRGARMMDHLASEALTVTLAVSLGQVRTLIEHPASMTHAPIPVERQPLCGIEPGGIRLSIGLEKPADVLRDLEEALEQATRPVQTGGLASAG